MLNILRRHVLAAFAAIGLLLAPLSGARAAAMSNYLENHLIDALLRGQTFTFPSTVCVALYTTAPTAAGGGTEVSGGSYARVSVTSSLANWAGTQGAGTTTASTGTSGATSNNIVLTYPGPTASWGSVVAFGVLDSCTLGSGNLLFFANLTAAKTVNNGDAAPSFAVGALGFSLN